MSTAPHKPPPPRDYCDNDCPSSFDQIAYWGAVLALTLFTVAFVFGLAGYALAKLGVL